MRQGHNGTDSKIPVLPLVDILFSAFAAVLATATVAIVLMRVREPDANLPVLPFFTIVAVSSDTGCTGLSLNFVVTPPSEMMPPGGKSVIYSEYSLADLATNNGKDVGINAWYFANTDQKQDKALEKMCSGRICAQAGLAVLSAVPGLFKVQALVKNTTCPNTKVALLLGPLSAQLSDDDFKSSEMTFKVTTK